MGWFSDFVSNPVGTIADTASNAIETVGNIGQNVIDTVKEHPLEAAALAAAGYYFAPELGAWIGSDGTSLAGTAEGVSAGTTPAAVGASSADKALLYGDAGYGAGMTGAQTAAYDTGLAAGGAAAGGAAGATGGAAGSTLSSMLPYMAGGQVAAGLLQANAAKKAADVQSAAAQGATQLQGQMFNTINQQQAPYRTAGYGALNQIGSLGSGQYTTYDQAGNPTGTAQGTGYLTHQFDANDLKSGLAPNYDFMLQQGQMANQRAANVGGGALSGNTLQGLNKFTQDYAGNAYQNAFNNYQTQRQNIYNTLAGIAGIGQTGQTATNTAATNATNAASQLGVGSAAAQAAGTTGVANALGNTANNIIGNYTLASLLNQRGNVG